MEILPKLICVLAATAGLHVASTSPNPPLKNSDRTVTPTTVEWVLVSPYMRHSPTILYWCIALAETLSLVLPADMMPALGGDARRISASASAPMVLGMLLIASGALIRLACYRALGRHFTFETGILKNHELVTAGPYAVVRHPSYAGALLVYAGLVLYFSSPGTWAVECVYRGSVPGRMLGLGYMSLMSVIVSGLAGRMAKEDAALKAQFGAQWLAWADRCPYALIPGVY